MQEDPYKIKIDKLIEDLFPEYIESIYRNIQKIKNYLDENNFSDIRLLGHNMKGSGGGYGLNRISELGASLLTAAKSEDRKQILDDIQKLEEYLEKIEIEYIDMD
ncbi:MAG: Hpt domain-containing protein [Spirochaetia bacterium]|nr:Hpt domain-containing protein [Spirochaetia bacterium]